MHLSVTFKIFLSILSASLFLQPSTLRSLWQLCFSFYFSLTENTDLLNLHSHQQQLYPLEKVKKYTGWMIALVNAFYDQLDEETTSHLFLKSDHENDTKSLLDDKLHAMAQELKFLPYSTSNKFKSKHVQPIFHDRLKAVHFLCPSTFICTTASFNPCCHVLLQNDHSQMTIQQVLVSL